MNETVAESAEPSYVAVSGDGFSVTVVHVSSLNSPAEVLTPRRASFRAVYTAEREAILREGYPRGDTLEALLAACNALPGVPVSNIRALKTQLHDMGLQRAPDVLLRLKREHIRRAHVGHYARWNAVADEIVRSKWGSRRNSHDAIKADLLRATGQVFSSMAIQIRAVRLGIKRPGGRMKIERAPKIAKPRAPKPPAAPRVPPVDRPRGHMVFGHNGAQVQIAPAPKVASTGEYDPAAPGSVEARTEKARRMLAKGSAADVVNSHTRLPLRELYRLMAEIREARRA